MPLTESLNSRRPLPSARPASGSRLGPRTTSAITRTRISSMGPTLTGMLRSLRGSPPHGGVEILDLVDRTSVDARGQVLPAVVADDEHDVALVQLAGDAHRDRRDGARGDAGEDALLVEQPARPDDRVAVGDEDLPVQQAQVDDRRDEAVVERAQALHGLALHGLRGHDLDRVAELLLEAPAVAHQRAARAEAGDERRDVAVELLEDLDRGALVVGARVRRVAVLVRHVVRGVLLGHLQ